MDPPQHHSNSMINDDEPHVMQMFYLN